VTYFRRRWRMGRRDAALLLLGSIWLGVGGGFLAGNPPTPTQRAGLEPLIEIATFEHLGWVWLTSAALGLAGGVLGRRRVHWEGVGFSALIVPPCLWAGCYLVMAARDLDVRLVVPGLIYVSIVATVGLIAGWSEVSGEGAA
jgi:hypothetical protein